MSAFIQGKGDVFGPIGAVAGNIPLFDGTSGKIIKDGGVSISAVSAMPRGHVAGLQIANGTDATNDINIGEGECRDSANSADIKLPATITKQLDAAWAAGTNQGGRDAGAIADVWWHVHAIKNPMTGVVDALFSQSATAPTLPSGFTAFRRIGSILRTAAIIQSFLQFGDMFAMTQTTPYSSTATRAAALFTLPRCPLGIITFPILKAQVVNNSVAANYFVFYHGLDSAFSIIHCPQQNTTNAVNDVVLTIISTNYSSQIIFGTVFAAAPASAYISHVGYYDNRGKDGYSP